MKLIILVQSGSIAGQRREFESGLFVIGRGDDSNLKFDLNERLVSKRHAVIERRNDGFYLKDLNSTNGVFVNGARVFEAKLKSNDAVQLGSGGPQIAVAIEPLAAAAETPAAPVNPAARQSEQQQQRQSSAPPQPTAASRESRQPNPAPVFANAAANIIPPPAVASPEPNQFEADEKRGASAKLSDSFINLGFYNPELKSPRASSAASNNNQKYIAAAIIVVVIVFLALLVTGLMVFQLGIVASFIAAFVAFLPAAVYVLPLLWLDRYDPEPPLSLALAFAWGALVAILVSFVINTAISLVVGQTLGAIISAPIFEEGSKGLGVLLLLIFWRKEFDGIVDGIVYAGVIALGFATVENVLYYGRGIIGGGSSGLLVLFVLRGIMSPFAHVIFTSMTGIGCGISRETHNKILRFAAPVAGYIGAVTLHAIWNTLSSIGGLGVFLIGYLIFEVPFFLIFVGFAVYLMIRENRILKQTLSVEVAKGTITKEQMETATSIFRSLGWTLGGISNGKIWARRKFLRAVSKLGLAWWHISRAQAAGGETRSLGQLPVLEDEIKRWRMQV